MSTTTSGAVGFAPVGTFVNDLAKELGKSASTLTAYLRKHLPTTLSKRKNSNNRLANWVTSEGEAGLRAHYKPTYAPQTNALVEELERLREENKQLRARIEAYENRPQKYTQEDFDRWKEPSAFDEGLEIIKELTEEYKRQIENNWRQTYEQRKQRKSETSKIIRETREMLDRMDAEDEAERESRVVRFPSEKIRKTEE